MNMITTMIKIAVIAISIVFCSCGKSGNDVADKGELLSVSKVYSIGSVGSHLKPQAGNSYNPTNLIDGDSTTTWALPFKGNGSVILDFHVRSKGLKGIEIYNGYGKSEKRFNQNSRAKEVSVYSDKVASSKLLWKGDLKDTMGFQTIPLTSFPKETSHIYIRIHSVYLGDSWNDLCISEVKFFGEKADPDTTAQEMKEEAQSSSVKKTSKPKKAKSVKKQNVAKSDSSDTPVVSENEEDENFKPEIKGELDPWSSGVAKIHLDETQVASMSRLRYVVLTELQKKSLSEAWSYDTISALSENWADCTCMMVYCYWTALDTIAIEKGFIPVSTETVETIDVRIDSLGENVDIGIDVDVGAYFSSPSYVVVGIDGNLYREGKPVSIEELKKEQDANGVKFKKVDDLSEVIGCFSDGLNINFPSLRVMRKSFRDALVKRLLDAGLKFCVFG